MSVLHTLSKSPDSQLLAQCLAVCGSKDGILFIEDGVYHALHGHELDKIPSHLRVYGLQEDIQARGLLAQCNSRVKFASISRFVELCVEFDKVVSWF